MLPAVTFLYCHSIKLIAQSHMLLSVLLPIPRAVVASRCYIFYLHICLLLFSSTHENLHSLHDPSMPRKAKRNVRSVTTTSCSSNDQNDFIYAEWGPVKDSVLESPRFSPRSSIACHSAWPDAPDRLARYTIEINRDSPSSQPTIIAEKKQLHSLYEIDERRAQLESLHKQKVCSRKYHHS